MFSTFWGKIKKNWDKIKQSQIRPIRTQQHDITLLRRARGRFMPNTRQIMLVGRFLDKKERKVLILALLIFIIGFFWLTVFPDKNDPIQSTFGAREVFILPWYLGMKP